MPEDPRNATIIEREDVNPALFIMKIRPDTGQVPDFLPGQYTSLGLPKPAEPGKEQRLLTSGRVPMIRRPYSIASGSNTRDHMEFYITLVETGRFTPLLYKLGVGGRVWMDTRILGDFTLEGVPEGKDFVFVSTGTGLTPFLSMIRTHYGTKRWRRLAVINGCRYARDLGYRRWLEDIQQKDSTFTFLPIVTREPEGSDYRGLRGRVQSILNEDSFEGLVGWPLDPDECHVFLCGNPQMLDEAEVMLQQRGFKTHKRNDPGNIHLERYW